MNSMNNKQNIFSETLSLYAKAFQSLQHQPHILNLIDSLYDSINTCFNKGGKLFICGNGGFASVSQHVASEFIGKVKLKRNPLPAISLSSDCSVITCIANDFGFEKIFSRQLEALGHPYDIFVALSVSGTSKNILDALATASHLMMTSFLISGEAVYSEPLELGATVINLPTAEPGIIQDLAMAIFHYICSNIEIDYIQKRIVIWDAIIETAKQSQLTTLILDRDGTVNKLLPNNYVLSKEQLILDEDFLTRCKDLSMTFKKIFIITNQRCVGKGLVSREEIDSINMQMMHIIHANGGRIDKIFVNEDFNQDSIYCKPNTGFAELIRQEFPNIDFTKSIVVGDMYSDELFAKRIGAHFFNIQNV